MLLCCVLLSAGARGLSIHDGVSIQICGRYWRRGQGKKKPTEKNGVGFSVSFFWGNRKTDLVGFRPGKPEQNRPKKTTFGFRFTTLCTAVVLRYVMHCLLPGTSTYQMYTGPIVLVVFTSNLPGYTAQQGLQQSSSTPKHTSTAAACCNAHKVVLAVSTVVPHQGIQHITTATTSAMLKALRRRTSRAKPACSGHSAGK